MSTITQRYASQCLAGSGIAIMASAVAWQLRPDLWASGADCGLSGGWGMSMQGARAWQAEIEGWGTVRVLARSEDMLAERIGWIVGARVTSVTPATERQATPEVNPLQREAERQANVELARLQRLAAQEPPPHKCQLRAEILEARAKLGMDAPA